MSVSVYSYQSSPTAQDAALAQASGQRLSRYKDKDQPLSFSVLGAEQDQPLQLPASAVALLTNILEAMATGKRVSIVRESAELTSVQAAEVLRVSRPYLIKLLAEGVIPHRKVGKHRRILMEDVIAYKSRTDHAREAVLDQLALDGQENGMGYSLP